MSDNVEEIKKLQSIKTFIESDEFREAFIAHDQSLPKRFDEWKQTLSPIDSSKTKEFMQDVLGMFSLGPNVLEKKLPYSIIQYSEEIDKFIKIVKKSKER